MCDAPKSKANKTRTPAVPMLCDVNVLLALVTDRHVAHAAAGRWLDGVPAGEATICRMAQTGLLRLLNNPTVMREEVLDTSGCWAFTPRLWTDAYLAAYAQASGLTLVTFDQGFRQFDP
jgi:uncharacterized protein